MCLHTRMGESNGISSHTIGHLHFYYKMKRIGLDSSVFAVEIAGEQSNVVPGARKMK